MARNLQQGDRVRIYWKDRAALATITHVPSDTGDSWQIQYEEGCGEISLINVYSSEFVEMVKLKNQPPH